MKKSRPKKHRSTSSKRDKANKSKKRPNTPSRNNERDQQQQMLLELSSTPLDEICEIMDLPLKRFISYIRSRDPEGFYLSCARDGTLTLYAIDDLDNFDSILRITPDKHILTDGEQRDTSRVTLLLLMFLNEESHKYIDPKNGQNLLCIAKLLRAKFGLLGGPLHQPQLKNIYLTAPINGLDTKNWQKSPWITWSKKFNEDVQTHKYFDKFRYSFSYDLFEAGNPYIDRGNWRNQKLMWLEFSDGVMVTIGEIHDHPYHFFLSQSLQKIIDKNDPKHLYLDVGNGDLPCTSWLTTPELHGLKEEERRALTNLLFHFNTSLKQGSVGMGLVSNPATNQTKILPLSKLKIIDLQRQISVDPMGFIEGYYRCSDDEKKLNAGWYLDSMKTTLIVDPVNSFLEHSLRSDNVCSDERGLRFRSSSTLNAFQNWLKASGHRLDAESVRSLGIDDFNIQLNIAELDDSIDFPMLLTPSANSFDLSADDQLQLSTTIKSLIASGLSTPSRARVTAASRPQQKRLADLKILRHQGLNRFIAAIAQDEQSEEKLSALLASILKINSEELKNKLSLNNAAFKDRLGQRTLKLLKEWPVTLKCQTKSLTFIKTPENEFLQVNWQAIAIHLASRIIDCLSPIYDKELYSREKIKSLLIESASESKIKGWSKTKSHGLLLNCIQRPLFIARALESGFDVFVGDKPIESLASELFAARLNIEDSQSNDWFDMHPEYFFDGKKLSVEDAQRFNKGGIVPYNGQMYYVDAKKLPKSKWLDYFWNKIKGQQNGSELFKDETSIVEQEPSWVLNLLALKLSGVPVIGGERWKKVNAHFDRLLNGELKTVESKLPLKPFQNDGLSWLLNLYHLGLGGILADDMGLGKTIQAIGFLHKLKEEGALGRNLIVVPTSLIHNWQSEFQKFAPDLDLSIFLGRSEIGKLVDLANSEECIYLTTYGLMERYIDDFSRIEFSSVIFDEAQNLKNIKSKRTGCARQLKAKSKFCLSGTPLENHYGEFYSLIDLAVPGALGNYDDFSKRYIPNRQNTRVNIEAKDIQFLRLKTTPLVLRRSKEHLLKELPEKTETLLKLDFEKNQKKIYRETALSWNRNLGSLLENQGAAKAQLQMLTALMRMRQICSFPQILPSVDYKHRSPKLEQLISMLGELSEHNEPVVVFTNFRTTLALIEGELKKLGVFCLSISGDTPLKKRAQILEQFEQAKGHVVLLMTQKVGGVGLNLTNARYVFHIEPWWNPQVENQATDRVHRMGQKRAVQVYRFVIAESVEEKIEHLKAQKSNDFKLLLDQEVFEEHASDINSFRHSQLSKEDFEYLIN